ncbi:hypothetical protein Cob_v011296 [Colletotrichum orbiculare MAFF 240422]|uniref:Uncharacterized protein n=1 Tax=Colletotrichum orbiculare (strain 104-T / ATCC 96160 / CBS 514.97 / LARS 414 / MAFF 240422) TaxID=1213857 RepID=A0A484FCT0_COLOR|nr:hypothetical protein Cob_v011296 [Colletotrichum orbiculare MAFF 240422]
MLAELEPELKLTRKTLPLGLSVDGGCDGYGRILSDHPPIETLWPAWPDQTRSKTCCSMAIRGTGFEMTPSFHRSYFVANPPFARHSEESTVYIAAHRQQHVHYFEISHQYSKRRASGGQAEGKRRASVVAILQGSADMSWPSTRT